MQVYISEVVAAINLFYGGTLTNYSKYPIIRDHLKAIADKLWEGIQKKEYPLYSEINNYHPEFLGKQIQSITKEIKQEDCYQTIASEYGFNNWKEVIQLGEKSYDINFEETVNYMLAGRIDKLKETIRVYPYLLHQGSGYGHHATLLHYVASNGVELWRQQVPSNLPEITAYLINKGADPKAKMLVYGGEYDVLSLFVSSAHPYDAGIRNEMKKVLQ